MDYMRRCTHAHVIANIRMWIHESRHSTDVHLYFFFPVHANSLLASNQTHLFSKQARKEDTSLIYVTEILVSDAS